MPNPAILLCTVEVIPLPGAWESWAMQDAAGPVLRATAEPTAGAQHLLSATSQHHCSASTGAPATAWCQRLERDTAVQPQHLSDLPWELSAGRCSILCSRTLCSPLYLLSRWKGEPKSTFSECSTAPETAPSSWLWDNDIPFASQLPWAECPRLNPLSHSSIAKTPALW